MLCRSGCGACCIAPSISSPIPGMPNGKAAGVPCVQLLSDLSCAIFDDPARPKVCGSFTPEKYICGNDKAEAITILNNLEDYTCTSNTSSVAEKYS